LGAFTTTPNNRGQQQLTPDLQQLQQQVLGHTFSNPVLLQQALTHVSRAGGSSYQRLEFLGDAVLDLYVSSWLMMQLGQALQQQAGAAGRWGIG
jgi:dsRNA-specific ribonuclease